MFLSSLAHASRRAAAPACPQRYPPVLQVRNAQLDKEAAEQRLENETLLRNAEELKHSAVQSSQVPD